MSITDINAYVSTNGDRIIYWSSDKDLPEVQVQRSQSGAPSDWTTISPVITSACSYTDSARLCFNKGSELMYRVLVPSTGDISCEVQMGTDISWPYSNVAQATLKCIEAELRTEGTPGALIKKRQGGTQCPDCTDFGTGRSLNEHCPACAGTGIVTGYYDAIDLYLVEDDTTDRHSRTPSSYAHDGVLSGRCIAYPLITRGDLWVPRARGTRYMIDTVKTISKYRGTPLVYQLVLAEIEKTDVTYAGTVNTLLAASEVEWSPTV